MLANALFYVALTATLAATFLCAGLAATRATVHRLAEQYVAAGYQRAESSLQTALASDLSAGPLPSPLPTFTPIPAACVDASDPCRFQSAESITLTQSSSSSAASACDQSKTNCAVNEEANGYVDENRLTARIAVTVTAADGEVLITRTADLVLRTMNTPPYLAFAGSRDGTFDDVAAAQQLGDDGGAPPATPNPCASAIPGTSDDTVVRVAYRNAATSACSDGSAWRTASYDSTAAGASGWSP